MFVDQVASTRQCAELGDSAALALHARLQQVVLRHITARGGWQANSTGDGALAIFASPAVSIAAACAIQSELRAANRGRDHLSRTDVRIGIHVGEPLIDADGMPFGLCVNLAARICARAGAGDVLVSDLVRELLGPSDRHLLVAPRWVALRGARHSTRLWRLPGTAIPDGAPMADPRAARMDRGPARPRLSHGAPTSGQGEPHGGHPRAWTTSRLAAQPRLASVTRRDGAPSKRRYASQADGAAATRRHRSK
jgi:class 3 adenylate cyclase